MELVAVQKKEDRVGRHVLRFLRKTCPKAFKAVGSNLRPLSLTIGAELRALVPMVPLAYIDAALRSYTLNYVYLEACVEGAERINIFGKPAGTVSAVEAEQAQLALAKLPRVATGQRTRRMLRLEKINRMLQQQKDKAYG